MLFDTYAAQTENPSHANTFNGTQIDSFIIYTQIFVLIVVSFK
jgi:hypothetical protein